VGKTHIYIQHISSLESSKTAAKKKEIYKMSKAKHKQLLYST
jgi:hypothetical protein